MAHRTVLTSVVLAFALTAPLARAQNYYEHGFLWTATGGMQDLGVPPGWTYSSALAISNSGLVVGGIGNPSTGAVTAARWTPSNGWSVLGKGLSAKVSAAYAVNDREQIVGSTYTTGTTTHAFLWTPGGGMQDLGTLGGDFSVAYGINNSGDVVGESTTAADLTHAFLWTQSGGMQDLGALQSPRPGSIAYAISENGNVVGVSVDENDDAVPVRWVGGQVQVLTGLGENPGSSAFATNGIQIVGGDTVGGPRGEPNAFLWSVKGGVQNLPLLPSATGGVATGINASGQVVGYDDVPNPPEEDLQAFIWSAGSLQNLGTLGGPYTVANGINDSGQIVGYSTVP